MSILWDIKYNEKTYSVSFFFFLLCTGSFYNMVVGVETENGNAVRKHEILFLGYFQT